MKEPTLCAVVRPRAIASLYEMKWHISWSALSGSASRISPSLPESQYFRSSFVSVDAVAPSFGASSPRAQSAKSSRELEIGERLPKISYIAQTHIYAYHESNIPPGLTSSLAKSCGGLFKPLRPGLRSWEGVSAVGEMGPIPASGHASS